MKYRKFVDGAFLAPISIHASDLFKEPNIIIQLDTAPDGVMRFIEIFRNEADMNLVHGIADYIGVATSQLPEKLHLSAKNLVELINDELLKKGIVRFNDKNHSGDYYLTEKPLSLILPDTFLTQILGRGSKLDLLQMDFIPQSGITTKTMMNTKAISAYGDQDFQEARKEIESYKYLAISIMDNSISVVNLEERSLYENPKSIERFRAEDISSLSPKIQLRDYDSIIEETDYSQADYSNALTRVANNNRLRLFFKISRQRLARSLNVLVGNISNLHEKGLIHGDLKPPNILCTKEGMMPVDALNVKNGMVSPGMTTNFCAPELILTRPVSPATDVYNIGLILLSIVDGVLYGKTSAYAIPTGNTGIRKVNLLTEPEIYIDYERNNIQSKEGIPAWQTFLGRCMAFEQKQRFQDVNELKEELNGLLDLYPLVNHIVFEPYFGRLSLIQTNNMIEAAWFVK